MTPSITPTPLAAVEAAFTARDQAASAIAEAATALVDAYRAFREAGSVAGDALRGAVARHHVDHHRSAIVAGDRGLDDALAGALLRGGLAGVLLAPAARSVPPPPAVDLVARVREHHERERRAVRQALADAAAAR